MDGFPTNIVHSSGVQLRLERDRVVVTTEPTATANADPLSALGLVPEREARTARATGATDPKRVLNERSGRVWARSEDGSAVAAPQLAASPPDGLTSIGPVYTGDFGGEQVSIGVRTDVLIVTPTAGRAEAEAHLEGLGLKIDDERTKYLGNELWCEVDDPLEASSLDLLSEVADSPAIAEARFEMIPMYRPHAFQPNDPLSGHQWNITQIRAAGVGHTGWNDQRGVASVIIGVLDDGVQLNHPDLRIAANGIDLGTMGDDGSPNGSHGTACAGCAAAIIHNGEGVAGVAGGCSVLPIAFDTWSDTEVAAGIRYAIANDVDVLSMSFGWDAWDRDVIDPAIQEAYDADIVMCVATHNHNRRGGITYPATNPLVIACGASDQADNRKSPSSPDGEGWGSNYGPQISVVAPGVLIPTTDRLGGAGYSSGDYTMTFNGTSSATPQVAGLAALLLSCDSSLTPSRVREIIETTAAKVGSVGYASTIGKPNGTWNEQMGYGRIDVEAAVHELCKTPRYFEGIDWGRFRWWEDFKIRQIKEKERIEELKNIRVYELPDFEPVIDDLIQPEDLIDGPGRLFVNRADRNVSGDDLARTVRRRR